MWIKCEVWDDIAKEHLVMLRKGSKFNCVGNIISNKWTDKNNGEERKQFSIRVNKILSSTEMQQLVNIIHGDSIDQSSISSPTINQSKSSPKSLEAEDSAYQIDEGYANADRFVQPTNTKPRSQNKPPIQNKFQAPTPPSQSPPAPIWNDNAVSNLTWDDIETQTQQIENYW
jgi:single-stranded DNA-binding protein